MYDIKVVGVGSGGCRAVNHMIAAGLKHVDFIAMDTDAQVLNLNHASTKIHLGWQMMRQRGGPCPGNEPETGRQAAEESVYDIRAALRGADLVIIVAAMGGGTGSGAVPVIAEEARRLDGFPIAVTCSPFVFEGTRRRGYARAGLDLLAKHAHAVFNISAARALSSINPNLTLDQAYQRLDDMLFKSVHGLTTSIAEEGRVVNLKLSEICSLFRDSGYGTIGIGEVSGPDGAAQAVTAAIESPLLDFPIDYFSNVFLGIVGGEGLSLNDVMAATERFNAALDPDTNVQFNAAFVDTQPERVTAIILCSGLQGGQCPRI